MISKILFISFFSFIGIVLHGQNSKLWQSKIYYNVEDSTPVCRIDITSESTKPEMYYYFGKHSKKIPYDVHFIGGHQALTCYFDSLYFNREDYNEDELNVLFYYTVLFDKNLKIKDVKILQIGPYYNSKFNYDNLIKKILFSTEGRWIKSSKSNHKDKWSLAFGILKLK